MIPRRQSITDGWVSIPVSSLTAPPDQVRAVSYRHDLKPKLVYVLIEVEQITKK